MPLQLERVVELVREGCEDLSERLRLIALAKELPGIWDYLVEEEVVAALRLEADDGLWSLDQLLKHPLPDARIEGSASSVGNKDHDRQTHPTKVERWENYKEEIWERLQGADVQAMREKRYAKISLLYPNLCQSEDGAVASLHGSAGVRLNHVFEKNEMNVMFAVHPANSKLDSQLAEIQLHSIEKYPEEKFNDAPDIQLLEITGPFRQSHETIKCKTEFRLLNAQRYHLADIWNFSVHNTPLDLSSGPLVPDAVYNVVHVISLEYGYTARRGHLYGGVSTFSTTWMFKADGEGGLKISEGIRWDTRGDLTHVSVTQALLFAGLKNYDQRLERKPYPTAKQPGGIPQTAEEVRAERVSTLRSRALDQSSAGGSTPLAPGTFFTQTAPLHPDMLHLIYKVAPRVFLGSLRGHVVAVRIALDEREQLRAMNEAEAYAKLESVQGVHVPRLRAHGYSHNEAAYFVATDYVEGATWEWESHAHLALGGELLAALQSIHAQGVLHGDLHAGNIIVAPDQKIFILDFNGAEVQAPADKLDEEQERMAGFLVMQKRWIMAGA